MHNITLSTSWYILKSKFNILTYLQWIDNMLSNVNNYNLVIYSDEPSSQFLHKYLENPNIKLIIKPFEQFYMYKYKDDFIKNHEKNIALNNYIDWKLHMLWCEKTNFVKETVQNKYFDTEFYGWCDIGYFRNLENDSSTDELRDWPNNNKITELNKEQIYYACINNDKNYIFFLYYIINSKNEVGLPTMPIPDNQLSIAGGFFILHKTKIEWWHNTFDTKLALYFKYDYLVKDDQIIIIDCVLTDLNNFCLLTEESLKYNNWFLFQRFLL